MASAEWVNAYEKMATHQGLGPLMESGAEVESTGGNCMIAVIKTARGYVGATCDAVAVYAVDPMECDDDGEWPEAIGPDVTADDVTADDAWLSTPWAISSDEDALKVIMSAIKYAGELHDEWETYITDNEEHANALALCDDATARAIAYLNEVTR